MCDDPVTTSILFAVGTGLSIAGTLQQSRAEADALEQNSAIAQRNSEIARRDALARETEADAEIAKQRKISKHRVAGLESQIAKSGALTEGSPLLSIVEEIEFGESDIQNILRQQEQQSANLRMQAGDLSAQSSFLSKQASSTKRAGVISAVGQGVMAGAQLGASGAFSPAKPKVGSSFMSINNGTGRGL